MYNTMYCLFLFFNRLKIIYGPFSKLNPPTPIFHKTNINFGFLRGDVFKHLVVGVSFQVAR